MLWKLCLKYSLCISDEWFNDCAKIIFIDSVFLFLLKTWHRFEFLSFCSSGQMDHGGSVLRSDSPAGWRYGEVVCGRLHWLDNGPGFSKRLNPATHHQRTQPLRSDHPQTPAQPFSAQVSLARGFIYPWCAQCLHPKQSTQLRNSSPSATV